MFRIIFLLFFFLSPLTFSFSQEINLSLINNSGNNLSEKIKCPYKFKRSRGGEGTFSQYIKGLPLEDPDSLTIKTSDIEKESIFFILKFYSEYLYKNRQEKKLNFHYTNGYVSSWQKYKKNYRIDVAGSLKKWTKFEKIPDEYDVFQKFLKDVFSYTDIKTIQEHHTKAISIDRLQIGDFLPDPFSEGQALLVVDICQNSESGERAFLLAQYFSQSNSFSIQKNPFRINDPWYYESDLRFPLRTSEYVFPQENWRRFK